MKLQRLYRIMIRFKKLPWSEKLLVSRVAVLLVCFRISLRLIPFNVLYRFIRFFLKQPIYAYSQYADYTQRVIREVERSGNYLLKTKCLAQGLAVHILLNRKRIINDLQVGFVKNKNRLSAHAWVKAENTVLIGGNQNLPLYFTIPFKPFEVRLPVESDSH